MDFKNGFGDLLKQAQQMQKNLEAAQKELADLEAIGESGVDPLNVKVTVNGRHEVKKVYISPAVLKEDKEFLEDMLVSAFNAAIRKAEELSQEKMSGLMGNMKLPEGFPGMFGGDNK
jgi:hypothetical protein